MSTNSSPNQSLCTPTFKKEFKVVFVGDSSVGKTSIINIANTGEFLDTTPTIGACFLVNTYVFDNCQIKLNLWDTAGQEKFRSLTPIFFRDMDIGILVYAVNSLESFNSISFWYESIMAETNHEPMLFLLGNKCDVDTINITEDEENEEDENAEKVIQKRAVTAQMGTQLAQRIHATFYEVSAKNNGKEIRDILFHIAKEISKHSVVPSPIAQTAEPTSQNINKKGCCD